MFDARDFGLVVKKSSGNEQLCLCPYHLDRHASSSFNTSTGLFYCFACGAKKNLKQLAQDFGVDLDFVTMNPSVPLDIDFFETVKVSNEYKFSLNPAKIHIDYLKDRMVDYNDLLDSPYAKDVCFLNSPFAGIGFVGAVSDSAELLSVQVRAIDALESRYKKLGEHLPWWPLRNGYKDNLVVVEGVFSALRLCLVNGVDNVVSSLGTSVSSSLFQNVPITTLFVFDGDVAGHEAAKRIKKLGFRAFVAPFEIDAASESELGAFYERCMEVSKSNYGFS